MLTERQIKSKWDYIKVGMRNMWSELSEEDLNQIDGDLVKLKKVLGTKINDSDETIENDLNRVLNSYDNESDMSEHDTNVSSYMRSPEGTYTEPNSIRTVSKSQFQDNLSDIKTRSNERNNFDEKSKKVLKH